MVKNKESFNVFQDVDEQIGLSITDGQSVILNPIQQTTLFGDVMKEF